MERQGKIMRDRVCIRSDAVHVEAVIANRSGSSRRKADSSWCRSELRRVQRARGWHGSGATERNLAVVSIERCNGPVVSCALCWENCLRWGWNRDLEIWCRDQIELPHAAPVG